MPRYFFHVIDGRDIIDNEGSELADLKKSRAEAIQLAGAILRDEGDTFWNGQEWHMDVTEPQGSRCSSSVSQPKIKAPRLKRTTRSRSRLSPFSASYVLRDLFELQASIREESGKCGRDESSSR